jgi:predicted RNA-binding protein with RPS1 domain
MVLKLMLNVNVFHFQDARQCLIPGLSHADTIAPNSIVKGKISKVAKKYVFVEVIDGVEGVIPINELMEEQTDSFKEGQEIEVKVLNMQCEARRMLLSMKQAAGEGSRSDITKYTRPEDSGSGASIGDILKAKMTDESRTERQVDETPVPAARVSLAELPKAAPREIAAARPSETTRMEPTPVREVKMERTVKEEVREEVREATPLLKIEPVVEDINETMKKV